jgi:branched-chain amino acid transport system permease protein
MSEYRIRIATNASPWIALAAGTIVIGLGLLPFFASRGLLQDLTFVFYMLALAQLWNLLAGYVGLVSVGQQAFVGLGGYLLFALTVIGGLDVLPAVLLAGVIAAVCALPTALIVFRLRGAYFAIGTWVVAEVYRLSFAQVKQLGGGTGSSLPVSVANEFAVLQWVKAAFGLRTAMARDLVIYWFALVLAICTVAVVYGILRSRHGLGLAAIRDSERAAQNLGVNSFRIKLCIYALVAGLTGVTGALIYLQKARISPDAAFSVLDWTAYVIFIVIIGGIGTIEGPILGVVVYFLMQSYLAEFGTWYLILLGMLGIAIILFCPRGIWGYLADRYGLVLFPVQRGLNTPRRASDARPIIE